VLPSLRNMQSNPNVEVVKSENESNLALLRRFSKRVQGSGILNKVRAIRYRTRRQSRLKRKLSALKFIGICAGRKKLEKLGKLEEKR
jgi:ribosomal protein S21